MDNFKNMEKSNAKFSGEVVNSAPKSTTNFYSLEKNAIKQNFPVFNPYVAIERLDLKTLKNTSHVWKEIKKDESDSSKESDSLEESESSEESEASNFLSEDSDYENETPTKKKTKLKKKAVANSNMSEYEKQIQRNIEERRIIFQNLVGGAKKDFMVEIKKEKKIKAARHAQKRKKLQNIEVPSLRMSLRIRDETLPITYKEEVEPESSSDESQFSEESQNTIKIKKGDQKKIVSFFTRANSKLNHKSVEDREFLKEMIPLLEKESESEKLPADPEDFLNVMKSFRIHEEGVAQVSKGRINCLAWHPSNYKLLVAVGDRDGNIAFWDVDNLEDKYKGVRECNGVHKKSINCINFDKFNPMRLLTSSNDGFVQSLDLNSNICDQFYSTDNSIIASHAQKNSSTLILLVKGNALVVDLRTATKRVENTIQCFRSGTGTLSLHPQDENLFMACDRRYGEIGIFDMRYTAANDFAVPVVSFPKAEKRVNGAFFSPITGQYALITCIDDTLKLYDVQKGKSEPECIKSIDHDNYTGKRIAPLKAVWHPQREDVFIVGSMEYPFRVEMYGAPSGTLLHDFRSDFLESETSINVFHPTVPVFAACGWSDVHIFRRNVARLSGNIQ